LPLVPSYLLVYVCPFMSSSYFHKYQMYFSKVNVSVLPHCQRVYPNTHCSGNDKSKGSQWVLSDATHCLDILHRGIVPRKTFQPFPKNRFCLPLDFGSGNRQPSTPIQRGRQASTVQSNRSLSRQCFRSTKGSPMKGMRP